MGFHILFKRLIHPLQQFLTCQIFDRAVFWSLAHRKIGFVIIQPVLGHSIDFIYGYTR